MNNFFSKLMFGLYFLIVLGLLAIVVASIAFLFINQGSYIHFAHRSFSTEAYALILAGITITLASAIIIPKVTLQREVEDQVNSNLRDLEEKMRASFKKEMDNRVKEESIKIYNDLHKMDAHLSRMFSFQLSHENPTWSIGWVFRSAKRYIKIPESETYKYEEFINILRLNIKRAKENLIGRAIKGIGIKNNDDLASKNKTELFDSISEWILENETQHEADQHSGDRLNLLVRTVKDSIDFEYKAIIVSGSNFFVGSNELVNNIEYMIREASLLVRLYTIILLNKSGNKEGLYNRLVVISEFSKDREFGKLLKMYLDMDVELKRSEVVNEVIATYNGDKGVKSELPLSIYK